MPEIARIAQTFAERRVTLRLTQQNLADLAGVSRYSIQSLERGTGSTKINSVVEIAEILGMRIEVTATSE
ncbi:helix-turn-helix domain-containing protein [Mycobacterium sp.]|uniref:helix-turn-helix transcriptional regulator n=1 Tax=Mycobacterium sp. TaxID=1785 RepID=UPI0031CECBCE